MTTRPSRTITVYTTGPTCQACRNTKRWLDKNGIPFTEIDVTTSAAAAAAARALGYRESPVVLVSSGDPETDLHWSGFNPIALTKYAKAVA